MRKIFQIALASLALSATHSAFAGLDNLEKYTIDKNHSFVTWQVSHFDYSHPTGKWLVDGTMVIDEKNPVNSSVKIKIKLANLVTGIPKLDEHLKSADFFNVAKYPVATFESNKVEVLSSDSAKVTGDLTLHGVTKPVTLNVKLNKLAESAMTHKKTAGFSANASLKRSDFGISAYVPNVSDDVKITIELEAQKDGADNAKKA